MRALPDTWSQSHMATHHTGSRHRARPYVANRHTVPSHTCSVPRHVPSFLPAFDPETWPPGPQPRLGGLRRCWSSPSCLTDISHQSRWEGEGREVEVKPSPSSQRVGSSQARAVPNSSKAGSSGPKSEPRVSPGGHVWSPHALGEGVGDGRQPSGLK